MPDGDALAIVPARGGSKRIPRKNIKPLDGVPLLTRTLRTLLDSGQFAHVVVSTDDDEIAEVAEQAGAAVPFRRPAELADDHAPTAPVVAHAVAEVAEVLGDTSDEVCVAYPAAVFVDTDDVVAARARLRETGADYAFTATTFAAPIQRALRVGDDGRAAMLHPEHRDTRSQDLEEHVHDAGQLYWGRRAAWLEQRPVLGGDSAVHVLPRWRVVDIDTPEDWDRAELLFQLLDRD